MSASALGSDRGARPPFLTSSSVSSTLQPALHTVAKALLVCAAYGLGSWVGFWLRFPPATTSVLWPPNAILTSVLLITPVRRWWIYLLAVFPVHVALQLQMGWSRPMILALFATNCSEALLAAAVIRRFSDAADRFDTFHRAAIFIAGAVAIAPFLSSFVDAAAVASFASEPYWVVWRARFCGNALTELAIVPTLVIAVGAWKARRSPERTFELALLVIALIVVGVMAFGRSNPVPGVPHASIAMLLPLMLWAAVRLGPLGASVSILTTVVVASFVATKWIRPLTALAPAGSVLAFQVSLALVGIPLLCLAALTEERRRAVSALAERLRFEELLRRLTGGFVQLPSDQMDAAFQASLRRLSEYLHLDRILLMRGSLEGEGWSTAYTWAAPTARPVSSLVSKLDVPWVFDQIRENGMAAFSRIDELPAAAHRDRETFMERGIVSGLGLALKASGRVLGILTFSSMSRVVTWDPELVRRLQLVAEVLANALARKESEDALRASEVMKAAILASLASRVAVLDRDGRIIAVNESWARFVAENAPDAGPAVGQSYLERWGAARVADAPEAAEILAGVSGVLDGSREGFVFEYPNHTSSGDRWFAMWVVPLRRSEGGAVVSHTEITERRQAEAEAQESRQELAHFLRVSTMGVLTTSLAHELNQPLTAILANAQAARLLLDAKAPDLAELHEILSDMIEEDKRAGEVIRRLRDLLKKGETERAAVDLNGLLRDVSRVVRNDAMIRSVTVRLDLDSASLTAVGDRVQIQQVVLNLLLNAMDAVAERAPEQRIVTLRTERPDAGLVQVSVADSGVGLAAGAEERVFDPFYTTKSHGMGMGLSIARSIVQAHGGAIWARNNPTSGATLAFSLPAFRISEAGHGK